MCILFSRGFRITFTANGRNDNMVMFFLFLPLTVFSFSVKFSFFYPASRAFLSGQFFSMYKVVPRDAKQANYANC